MKRILSTLRGRIVLAAAMSTLVVLVGFGGLVLAGARRDARADLDRRLQSRALQIARLPAVRTARLPRTSADSSVGALVLAGNDIGVRVVLRGRLIDSTGLLPDRSAAHLPTGAGTRTFRMAVDDRWRGVAVQVVGRPRLLVEAVAPLSAVDASVRSLRRRVVVIGLAGLLVALALATLAANYAVRSLGRLRTAAEGVAETDRLELRIPEDGPAEVHAVAHALNAMLGRLERSAADRELALQATKQFAADAGHELRTPLTTLQTSLETLARNPDLARGERQEIVEESLLEHRRLSDLVVALQALTRGDGGAMGDEQPLDLGDVVSAAAAALTREHPTARLTTDLAPGAAAVVASPTGVRLLVDNLLQNAARHGRGPDGIATIAVAVRAGSDGGVSLIVDDDGPGIAETERARVMERFVRGSDAAGEGSGLGLAIAAQQARRAGGVLEVRRSPAGGARFMVTLR